MNTEQLRAFVQVALVHRGEEYLTAAARALKAFIVDSLRRSRRT